MNNVLVSVKMITYNHEGYIAKAIESVLKQKTRFNYELVIGEDCSTDNTRQIVFDYQNRFPNIIRVIKSDFNVGAKVNSHRTLVACRGKYIAFLDGDDYWIDENKLEMQADFLNNHYDYGITFTNYDEYNQVTDSYIEDVIAKRHKHPFNIDVENVVKGDSGILTCTVMMRKSLIIEIKESDTYIHNSDNFLMGDIQLWTDAVATSKVHYIPLRTAVYNKIRESATQSDSLLHRLRFEISNMEMRLYLCRKYNLNREIINKFNDMLLDYRLSLAFHTHNCDLANNVRYSKKHFTAKQWAQYFGAKYLRAYWILNRASSLLKKTAFLRS